MAEQSRAVLITGCSSGIGRATAARLARGGWTVYATARRPESIADLEGMGAKTLALDVTDEESMRAAVAAVVEAEGAVGVLVNNAGYSQSGAVESVPMDAARRQFETNVFGVIRTLRAALPEVRKARGNLVIVGSVAGWCATPGNAPYAMSKFAVRALADAITPELARDGVTVTLISPGFVASEIRRVDNLGTLHPQAREPIKPWLIVPRERAARHILAAVARGRREAVITAHGKFFVFLARFAPWVIRAAGRRMARHGGYRGEAGH